MNKETRYERGVAGDLLESAKKHFLDHGYEKASLRKICADAGVTTGALYFAFKNKEDLFDALVSPTIAELDRVIEKLGVLVLEDDGKNFDEDKFNDYMFRFLIEHRDGVRLLMARAGGTHYEGFCNKVRTYVETLMTHYAKNVAGVDVDEVVISILTNMYFTAIADLISRDYDPEEMMSVAGTLRTVMEHGFSAMLEQQKAEG